MTMSEFLSECLKRTLLPELVLEESGPIREALLARDDEKVIELLDNFA